MPLAISGMHRSGSSVIARALKLGGVYLGDEQQTDRRFVQLNEEILANLGGRWDSPPPVPQTFTKDKRLNGLRAKARKLVREFEGHEPWGWSDPQTSLTMGLWNEVVPDLGVVVCLRNPLEVTLSLRREGVASYTQALELWEEYNLKVLEAAADGRRIVTDLESYFVRPKTELRRLFAFAGLPQKGSLLDAAATAVNGYPRHSTVSVRDLLDAEVAPEIVELYLALRREAGLRDPSKRGQRATAQSVRTGPIAQSAGLELVDLRERVKRLESIVDESSAEKPRRLDERLLAAVEELQSSVYDLRAESDPAKLDYRKVIRRVQETVRERVPFNSIVLVASKGDNELLKLYGRTGWHFPRTSTGVYAGYHPKCDLSAIAHLETLRARGARYIVFPSTAFWWFDHYAGFKAYLEDRYIRVTSENDDASAVFELRPAGNREGSGWKGEFRELLNEFSLTFGRQPSILDWNTGLELARAFPEHTVFSPAAQNGLPYLDGTVDIVALLESKARDAALHEADRVASGAVLVLSGGRANGLRVDAHWKTERTELPSASIVIPCFDGIYHTNACLTSLRETLPRDFRGEIVVVDDASTDGTADLLDEFAQRDERIRVVRNSRNRGFLESANIGAEAAGADVLVFLNNDTILLPGWLEPLLRVFVEREDAGAVGGRLVYPDGRLQEAGGLVFADGSAWKYGYGDPHPAAPLYSFFRETDYCSGCLLATRRSLFEQVGGFDKRFKPGFYEDTDYCFTVRDQGLVVYYEPQSTIVHVEGATAGTDLTRGPKRHQATNKKKFTAKWSKALRKLPERPEALDGWSLASLVNARGEGR